tara:strand:+ start:11 stop:307 length:297 start_codon:yes stop_codon:yes gene_type:complete
MATITHGSNGRTDVSSRSTPPYGKGSPLGSKAFTITATTELSGSYAGTKEFIVNTAGDAVLHLADGGSLAASNLNTKTTYKYHLKRIVTSNGNISIII